MAAEIITELGSIRMNDDIVATIAGYAAVENYGIVGMNAKTVSDAVTQLFGKDDIKKGVKITINKEGEVDVDLFVTGSTVLKRDDLAGSFESLNALRQQILA